MHVKRSHNYARLFVNRLQLWLIPMTAFARPSYPLKSQQTSNFESPVLTDIKIQVLCYVLHYFTHCSKMVWSDTYDPLYAATWRGLFPASSWARGSPPEIIYQLYCFILSQGITS